MEKVLIIANQFPPMGGSGVQRSVKFVKNLSFFGYEPIVLTRDATNANLKDITLLKDIPKNTKIFRTRAYEPLDVSNMFKIPAKVIAKIMIPDSAYIWYQKSKKKALDIIKKEKIKIIYTTSAPYSDHLLGLYIKEKMPNIKWVADFRDEWTNNPYTLDNPHNKIRANIEKRMEHTVLNKSDYIIANTLVMKNNFIKNNKINKDKFFVIPNGYDKDDFKHISFDKEKNDKFSMVYTGALYGRRKIDNLFIAIKNLKDKGIIKDNSINIKLIGNYHKDKLQALINKYFLADDIEIIGYVPHDKCIKYQVEADALILIEGGGRGSDAFYTGKIFEYMNTKRPVLAILPDGVAKDLVIKSKIGIFAHTDNIEDIQSAIKTYYEDFNNGSLAFNGDFEIIKRFERKNLTKDLANIFDKAIKINNYNK